MVAEIYVVGVQKVIKSIDIIVAAFYQVVAFLLNYIASTVYN